MRLLVVEHHVRQPDVFRGQPDLQHAVKLLRDPRQTVVLPLLRVSRDKKAESLCSGEIRPVSSYSTEGNQRGLRLGQSVVSMTSRGHPGAPDPVYFLGHVFRRGNIMQHWLHQCFLAMNNAPVASNPQQLHCHFLRCSTFWKARKFCDWWCHRQCTGICILK